MGLLSKVDQERAAGIVVSVSRSPAALAALPYSATVEIKQILRKLSKPAPVTKGGSRAWDGQRRHRAISQAANQTAINFCFVGRSAKRKERGWKRYPFKMVEDARAMRANGYTYVEISNALFLEHKIRVPWITIRDWTQHYYRTSR